MQEDDVATLEYDERVRGIVEDTLCVVARFNGLGVCEFISAHSQAVFAKAAEEIVGKPIWRIFNRLTPAECDLYQALIKAIEHGTREECVSTAVIQGVEHTFFSTFAPELVGASASRFVSMLTVDLSSCLPQLTSTVSDRVSHAPIVDRGIFLGIVAHELRNPLSSIASGLRILSVAPEGPDSHKIRSLMGRQIQQLSRIVNDLLDMSRAKEAKLNIVKSPALLSEIVSLAVETAGSSIKKGGHRLSVKAPEDPITLIVDANRISQVISNLLDNAARYTPALQGVITLAVMLQAGDLIVSVADNGMGIAPENKERIFRQYEQVQGSNPHSRSGLGLGLFLVRMIVEAHGGTIQVHSDGPGHGSEFVIRLPLVG